MTTTPGAVFQRLETHPLGDLTGYPGNARRGDVGMILESLTANGQFRPLVVRELEDGKLIVLAGNHTLQAMAAHGPGPCGLITRHGEEERPCALCHGQDWKPAAQCAIYQCDDATARRIVLADNRTSDAGSYDDAALAALLDDMDGDLAGTGYTDTDLTDLLEYLAEAETDEPEPYDTPEPTPAPEPSSGSQAPSPTAASPTGGPATSSVPATSGTPAPAARGSVVLTVADGDEASRLITAARDVLPDLPAGEIVLRALRALVAVIDSRHTADSVVTVAALLKAAGLDVS
ncbi:ParB/RepB/Spo0J family partition protein [Streptomyces fuscigenes]|uniref:ParB/RepB/Spo0J family partition protein n=1 Tax=Streptomyces fuscigenes TaxID=1528880 RepID=UPI001F255151|nr:ParB/Srx family N-terminal domain-containing protein [Streptomyces fuscigenes]MCF3960284.1 ParB/Srx family N-terminal domain-containing protein [Streptomyces fuscigenes]